MKVITQQGLTSFLTLIFLTLFTLSLDAQNITFDNNGQGRVTATASSISINNYTVPAGDNRVLLMFISYGGTEANITSAKFGTTNATLIESRQFSSFTTQVYYVALGSGGAVTANATATRSSNGVPFHLGLGSFKNVDQDNPIGNTTNVANYGNGSTVTFDVAEGNMAIDYFFHSNGRNPIPGVSQNQLALVNGGYDSNSSFKTGTGGPMSMYHDGNRSNNTNQIHLGFELVKAISFPFGFEASDGIGCVGNNDASFDADADMFSITSDGCWGSYPYTEDALNFVGTEMCGDGYIEAYIDNIDGEGFAGVMIRESLSPGAPKFALGTNTVDRISKEIRTIENYPSFPQEFYSLDKFWVKVERTGYFFKAYVSVDGSAWIPVLQQAILMDNCVQVGLFVRSKNAGEVVTTEISNTDVVFGMDGLSQDGPDTDLLGQHHENSLQISIQPNPAVDQVQLNLNSLIGQSVNIRIMNINGQVLTSRQLDNVESATESFDVSNLPAGTYWVNILSETIQETQKMIIQR